jgi:isopentenyl-diphosphate delta-isomerase
MNETIEDKLILVDENDHETGTEDKLAAHLNGLLHRAFSVLIFDAKGNILLQKRAAAKYHSAGLWTNTCCSHPAPREDTKAAAIKRLQSEMGFTTDLKKAFEFTYKTELENGITEHEYDHVFTGTWEGTPTPNPAEASDWKWISREELDEDIKSYPEQYTFWFKLIMERLA